MRHEVLRRIKPDSEVITLQKILSNNGYLTGVQPLNGVFDDVTEEAVRRFQSQHIGANGLQLNADGVVGMHTWWALENPSGYNQRNHFVFCKQEGLTHSRHLMLELLYAEHAKPVFEVPDGSNRSPDIDQYWGPTGLRGLAWCCAFVSWSLRAVLGRYPMEKHHVGVQNMYRTAQRLDLQCDAPNPGDVFVQLRSNGQGHTGFVIALSVDAKHIYTCEGNCGNRLKIGKRKMSTIHGYIDPYQDGQSPIRRVDFDVREVDSQGTR